MSNPGTNLFRKKAVVENTARVSSHTLAAIVVLSSAVLEIRAQSPTFAGNAQHQAQFATPAQHLNHLRWSSAIETNFDFIHYGSPVITASNTVIFASAAGGVFTVNAIEGATGRVKYTLPTDWVVAPDNSWGVTFGPVLTVGPAGPRLYYPGAGGTVYYIDNPDSDDPGTPVQVYFYMLLAGYTTNFAAYKSTVFLDTPITADSNGVIFFGFRVVTNAPPPLNTTNSGYARIAPDGAATYVLAPNAAGDLFVSHGSHNCAPALSLDETTLYVAVKSVNYIKGYLLGLDATTLATRYEVLLRDPRNNGNRVMPPDMATASPTVGPDGEVYLGVSANPDTGMGWMLHFSADLATQKLPSLFGWDYTVGVVPTNIVKGYRGASSYLLVSKYNNYNLRFYRAAILDPNAAQASLGINVMREVLTVTSPTAAREWCINSPAVNPATASVFLPSEDGHLYQWNLHSNSLSEAFTLNIGFGEPYVPTVVGPDGAVYTINGSTLYAIDSLTNLSISAWSSAPDERSALVAQPISFTAVVTNPAGTGPVPSGMVNFLDGSGTFATNIPVVNGLAQTAPTNLVAGVHFITVQYSGDAFYPTGMVSLVQRIHAKATTMILTSTVPVPGSNSVTFTAALVSPQGGTPTGMVAFWDGNSFLGQTAPSSGRASLGMTTLTAASHRVWAEYSSDATYVSCTGAVVGVTALIRQMQMMPDGSFQLGFTNRSGAPFSVLGSTELSVASTNWPVLGPAIEVTPGQFQFTDPQAGARAAATYYRVRSP
ncbi:MAG: hypothetical protein C5B50_24030 [Verrucomicrobia bacterium]|nr:MAG: hypothetical protein C5B50_24030 [Verrucomicrobiota bacterium]